MSDIVATLTAVWKGGQATDKAQNDIKGLDKSVQGLALEQQIAADKTDKFTKKTRELSMAVAKGEKSFESAEKELESYHKELGMGDKATTKSTGGIGNLAVGFGVAAGAALTLKEGIEKAYEVIGEGAELKASKEVFDNLAVSINTTADSLESNLKRATKGMLTDAEVWQSATAIMSLGLADTEEGVVRMGAAVGALSLDMDVLALTLANDSVARLDSLGLSMANVKRTQKELSEQGFVGDTFDEAVLIELEKRMILLGDASETDAGKLKIMENAIANMSNKAKIAAVDLASVPISKLSADVVELTSDLDRMGVALDLFATRNPDTVSSVLQTAEGLKNIALTVGGLKILGKSWDILATKMDDYVAREEGFSSGVEMRRVELEKSAKGVEEFTSRTVALASSTVELDDKIRQSAQHLTDEEIAIRAGNAAMEGSVEQRRLAREETERLTKATEDSRQAALDFAGIPFGADSIIEGYALLDAQINSVGEGFDTTAQKGTNLELKLLGLDAEYYPEIFLDLTQPIEDVGELETKIGSLTNEEYVAKVVTDTAEGLATAVELEDFLKGFSATTFTTTVKADTSAANTELSLLEQRLANLLGAAGGVGNNPATGGGTTGLATGGTIREGGMYTVGETGAERVYLPAGSTVQNSQQYNQQQYTINTSDVGSYMTQLDRQSRRK